MPEWDPERTMHQSTCRWCHAVRYVPLRESRLEEGPWRLTWRCGECGRRTRVAVAPVLIPVLLQQDRVYGMAISMREVEDFEGADLDDFAAAVAEELA